MAYILKALFNARRAEAECRALLALAVCDQLLIDNGSWLVAWELQLHADETPYATFASRTVASMGNRSPVTRSMDERFVDAVLSRLGEVEETIERRKKLEGRPPGPASAGAQAGSAAAGGGRPKGKGAGRSGQADGKAGALSPMRPAASPSSRS